MLEKVKALSLERAKEKEMALGLVKALMLVLV